MKFETIKRRVERSESLLQGRAEQTMVRARALKHEWRAGWTPTRIVLAGLIAGFAVGRSNPGRTLDRLGKLGGGRWLQAISSVSGLLAALQAAIAAFAARDVAETADDVAEDAAEDAQAQASECRDADTADALPPVPRSDRRRPDPTWDMPPRPAEAATELSEPAARRR